MTDTSEFLSSSSAAADVFKTNTGPILTENYWGFTVRNTANVSSGVLLLQLAAYLFGAAFAAAALGLWAVPSAFLSLDAIGMRIGLSGLFATLSFLLIGYANQGRTVELQFDQNLGEIRAVMPLRGGASRLVAQYGFDSFGEMTITRCAEDQVALTLKPTGHGALLVVAQGTEPQIGALYARLDRDLLRAGPVRMHRAVRPVFG